MEPVRGGLARSRPGCAERCEPGHEEPLEFPDPEDCAEVWRDITSTNCYGGEQVAALAAKLSPVVSNNQNNLVPRCANIPWRGNSESLGRVGKKWVTFN
ncbi:unnamed protein product [Coccothraustes coccothraustes]